MPWSNNHLPRYRKHRASGQAVVTLNGRDFYLDPHNTKASKREYDRLLGEWLQNNRNPLVASSDSITVVELCARYFRFAKNYYRKGGQCTGETPRIRIALRSLRQWYGKTPASEFGPLALPNMGSWWPTWFVYNGLPACGPRKSACYGRVTSIGRVRCGYIDHRLTRRSTMAGHGRYSSVLKPKGSCCDI